MKKLLFLCFFFCVMVSIHAQKAEFSLLESKSDKVTIKITFPDLKTKYVNINDTLMTSLHMGGTYPIIEAGSPELIYAVSSIIIPPGTIPMARIIDSSVTYIDAFELAPSKGKLYRNQHPDSISYHKGAAYEQDHYLPASPVIINPPYIFRDLEGITLHVYPCLYNPVQKTLKKYSSLTIEIEFHKPEGVTKSAQRTKISKEFHELYQRHFLNYSSAKYTPISEDGTMLIIAPEAFIPAVEPLAKWKIKSGIPTEIISIESIGTSYTQLSNYIKNYYTSHNLVYLLLVGDYNYVPSYRISSGWYNTISADNCYAEIVGSDHYPDIIMGRMSAESLEHVTTQVEKTILYESAPPETSHFPVFAGIASEESGDSPEYDFEHIRNIGDLLLNSTYTSGYEFFEGSQGGLDASGDPNATMVSNALNEGVGIVNYCGHGDWNLFVTSYFTSTNVSNLTNYDKLPFIISTACSNGDYYQQTCFAEYWLRAKRNERHTGAVAALMSSIIQAWSPPMVGQDEMNELIVANSRAEKIYGGIVFNGLMKILDVYRDEETTRTWLIFGDPSLRIRTAVPDSLSLNYQWTQKAGTDSITFLSSVEDANIVLSANNEIIGKNSINQGSATLPLSLSNIGDTIYVLASKFNHIPFQGIIVFNETGVPITKYNETITVSVYPNPFQEFIHVDIQNKTSTIPATITVFDIHGKLISKEMLSGSSNIVTLPNVNSGVYILNVYLHDNSTNQYFKIIKK